MERRRKLGRWGTMGAETGIPQVLPAMIRPQWFWLLGKLSGAVSGIQPSGTGTGPGQGAIDLCVWEEGGGVRRALPQKKSVARCFQKFVPKGFQNDAINLRAKRSGGGGRLEGWTHLPEPSSPGPSIAGGRGDRGCRRGIAGGGGGGWGRRGADPRALGPRFPPSHRQD